MEFLRRVRYFRSFKLIPIEYSRKEAAHFPKIMVASSLPDVSSTAREDVSIAGFPVSLTSNVPDPLWERKVLSDFSQLRVVRDLGGRVLLLLTCDAKDYYRIRTYQPDLDYGTGAVLYGAAPVSPATSRPTADARVLPPVADRDAWRSLVFAGGAMPTLQLLGELDSVAVATLLGYFEDWIAEHEMTDAVSLWLFALLAAVEKPLMPGAMTTCLVQFALS